MQTYHKLLLLITVAAAFTACQSSNTIPPKKNAEESIRKTSKNPLHYYNGWWFWNQNKRPIFNQYCSIIDWQDSINTNIASPTREAYSIDVNANKQKIYTYDIDWLDYLNMESQAQENNYIGLGCILNVAKHVPGSTKELSPIFFNQQCGNRADVIGEYDDISDVDENTFGQKINSRYPLIFKHQTSTHLAISSHKGTDHLYSCPYAKELTLLPPHSLPAFLHHEWYRSENGAKVVFNAACDDSNLQLHITTQPEEVGNQVLSLGITDSKKNVIRLGVISTDDVVDYIVTNIKKNSENSFTLGLLKELRETDVPGHFYIETPEVTFTLIDSFTLTDGEHTYTRCKH